MSGRVVVTGGTGFLGSHIAEELDRRGYAYLSLGSKDANLTSDEGMLRIVEILQVEKPDAIIHCAASAGGIGANQKSPVAFFENNMRMGMNVLNAASATKKRPKVVFIGTICAYPEVTPVPFVEDDLWNGFPEPTNAPYGVAKRALLTLGQAYRQHGLSVIHLLTANLYGPRDNFDLETSHVIPAMIRKFVEAKEQGLAEVVLWGDGDCSRDFLYVRDAARGIVDALEKYDAPEPVNLGTGTETWVYSLAETLARLLNFEGKIRWDRKKPNGQKRRVLNIERAKEKFNFQATTSLTQGLEKTLQEHLERTRTFPSSSVPTTG